jgi:thioredoxin-related protein
MPTGGSKVGGVHFLDDMTWEQLKEKARIERKYIFVDLYATWCGPCKSMDKTTYPNESVGNLLNEYFLSARVQCDTSKQDGDVLRAKYADAHAISTKYEVHAYPTFLFFSPDGEILHKAVGYYSPKDFVKVVNAAMDTNMQYFTLVKAYKDGKLDFSRMPDLADKARRIGDISMFSSVVRMYFLSYLDLLSDSLFFNKNSLAKVVEYGDYLMPSDRAFILLTEYTELVDQILEKKGLSLEVVDNVIFNEEVKPYLINAKKNEIEPNWTIIDRKINEKFGTTHKDPVLRGKFEWCMFKKDVEGYCQIAIERMDNWNLAKNTEDANNRESLNVFAWGLFQRSNDKAKLEKALSWSDLVIGAITDTAKHASMFIDTKANLLYKLGRKNEALVLEAKAVALNPNDHGMQQTLQKMQEGKATW